MEEPLRSCGYCDGGAGSNLEGQHDRLWMIIHSNVHSPLSPKPLLKCLSMYCLCSQFTAQSYVQTKSRSLLPNTSGRRSGRHHGDGWMVCQLRREAEPRTSHLTQIGRTIARCCCLLLELRDKNAHRGAEQSSRSCF
jgi:hypothetical protein